MTVDWIMVSAIAASVLYATLVVSVAHTYQRRMRRARRKLHALRHVAAAGSQPLMRAVDQERRADPKAA